MTGPRVLALDIETFPDLVWSWGVYEQNAIEVKQHWQMASFSAEWLSGDQKPRVVTKALPDYKGYKPGAGDRELVWDVWRLLEEADAVVAHNGADFDLRKMNARFIALGIQPPKPYKIIDTRKEVARVAGFSSNKLDWLARQLDFGRKLEHEGWAMWRGCIEGDPKCWAKMKRYNRNDVVLLKKLYHELTPWIRLPNLAAFNVDKGFCCPTCGGEKLQRRGFMRAKTRTYQRWQCIKCGTWARSTHSEKHSHASIVGLDPNTRA